MQAYRSSSWRRVTLRDRIPPPTGVVSGPLIATRCVRMASRVASGSQLPTCLKAFSPASTSSQSIWRFPPDTFRTVASNTRRAARQMSGPVPSPSMKGMMGWLGTTQRPSRYSMRSPMARQSTRPGRGCARRNVGRTLEAMRRTPRLILFTLAADCWLAAGPQRTVTLEEPSPVAITGFAVGRADYDRVSRSNTFTAGKIGVSLFKPVGDAYLFAQLTTALEDGASSTEIDNLLVSWTPHTANKWSLAFGRFDAPIGFERDDEPLNLIPTNSFSFTYARPGKLTGVQVHYTASPRVDVWGVVANGWDVTVDNNRSKTGLARIQVIPIPWVTLGFTGVYGSERDSSDANQRSLFSSDLTIDRGRLIVGAEANFGRDQQSGGNPSWRAAAVTAFLKMSRQVGLTARYDQMEDTDGLLTGTPQILRSVTVGPMWYFSSALEGIFSNIEHTRFHLPQVALRAAVRADWSSTPFFTDATGALQSSNTKGVLELVYVF